MAPMLTLAFYLAVPLIALAMVAGHLWFWRWYYDRRRLPDEVHYVTTEDGWKIALSRFRGGSGLGGGQPVICCPGLACNARMFDFDERRSLARELAAQGFDVWVMDPRGMGLSERPGWFGKSWRFGFEEFVQQDAPAAIRAVTQATGVPRVFWVGHSMGGLIGYHVTARHELGDFIAGVVALGSPADLSRHREVIGMPMQLLEWFVRGWPVVRLGRLCALIAPLAGRVRRFPETLFVCSKNTSGRSLRHFMVEVLEDVPRQLLDQFADNVFRDLAFDGRPQAQMHVALKAFSPPLLAIAGNRDFIAPPASVHAATKILGCEEVEEITLGDDPAESSAFGHLDLLIGDDAPRIIYPRVIDWLLDRVRTRETAEVSAPSSVAVSSAASQPD